MFVGQGQVAKVVLDQIQLLEDSYRLGVARADIGESPKQRLNRRYPSIESATVVPPRFGQSPPFAHNFLVTRNNDFQC